MEGGFCSEEWQEHFKQSVPVGTQLALPFHSFTHARGPWIQTAPSNTKYYFLSATPFEIKVEDVAFHLAGIYRYTGGSRITVAQHCVVASRMAARHYTRKGGYHLPAKMLVHDSPEAFLGDASSPLKSLLPDYKRLEAYNEAVFEERFDLFWTQDPLVKEIDRRLMLTERPFVFSTVRGFDSDWDMAQGLEPFPVEGDDMEPWSPEKAEAEWLAAFHNLLPWVSDW